MKRIILLATLTASLALLGGGYHQWSVQAATTCSASGMQLFATSSSILTGAQFQVSCSGGTADGWLIEITPQYSDNGGAWYDARNGNGNVMSAIMPTNSCSPRDDWAFGTTKNPDAIFDSSRNCLSGYGPTVAVKPGPGGNPCAAGREFRQMLTFAAFPSGSTIKTSFGVTNTC